MPRCEKDGCGKKNLKPEEVVYDENSNLLLCKSCAENSDNIIYLIPHRHQEGLFYDVRITSSEGLKADVRVDGSSFSFEVSNDDFKKLFGRS